MTAAAKTLADNWAARKPGNAARGSVQLLASPDPAERERGAALAAALRRADRCCVCGRQLSNKASMAAGVGSECRNKGEATRRALVALRAAGFDVADPEPHSNGHADAVPFVLRTDLTDARLKRERGPKVSEAKQWDEENSDHSPNVGSWAVQSACGMVELAVELVVSAGRAPMERLIRWTATRLLAAADEIQAGVRSDGRHDRMAASHARARGVLHTVLDLVPFPIDAVNDVGIVAPVDADRVHQWHADTVNAGVALLQMAVDISEVDWRTAA